MGHQVGQDPLNHGDAHNGQHLLGGRQGQRTEPGSLAADQDNCLHYFVAVVVVDGLVVVVDGTVVVVVGPTGTGEVVEAAVVGVTVGAAVVVVVGGAVPSIAWTRAVTVEAPGLGSAVLAGPNPMVMSYRSSNFRPDVLGAYAPPIWTK